VTAVEESDTAGGEAICTGELTVTVHIGAELYGSANVCEHCPLLIAQLPALMPPAPSTAACECVPLYPPSLSLGISCGVVLAKFERKVFPDVTLRNSVTLCPAEKSTELMMMVNPAVSVA
jgi:hypothetical protein